MSQGFVLILCDRVSRAGGTFALYSLLCRHAKFGLLPNYQTADEEISTYHSPNYSLRRTPSSRFRRSIERLKRRKTLLLLLILFGASLGVTLGALTPAISGIIVCMVILAVKNRIGTCNG